MFNILSFLTILFFLLLEGLFSGGEIALVAADINKIRHKANAGSRSAALALRLLMKPEWFLATTLTGTNLSAITNTALATALFISMFGVERGELISITVMIPLILIMGEVIPKSLFQRHAEFVALRISWFLWITSWLFYPVVFILSKLSRGAVTLFSEGGSSIYPSYITKGGLEHLLKDGGDQGDIMQSEKEMIQRIFDFSDATVEEIMVPLSNVTALPANTPLREATRVAAEKGFSRIPVYQDKIFNIIGILHSFDLLKVFYEKDSRAFSHDPDKGSLVEACTKQDVLFVPESKLAGDLFLELQNRGEHMAVVVDEYGGAVGIITVEDILEEIVGEIEDGYGDEEPPQYRKAGPGKYIFNAQTKIETLRELIPHMIPAGEYETLGGFLLHRMGRIPVRSEIYRDGQMLFVVEDADARTIKEVLIVLPPGMELAERD
ncbi:MAG: HlyC/CorC family transporter [Deltaproteobacteria bacterium]|nr:HlyC/CorC family transporter [Deltaproteobacteria bacterium]